MGGVVIHAAIFIIVFVGIVFLINSGIELIHPLGDSRKKERSFLIGVGLLVAAGLLVLL